MTAVIELYGRPFLIGYDAVEHARRVDYFRGEGGNLTDEETRLLEALGIDEQVMESLRPHMAQFFQDIAKCHSDPGVILSKNCELPFYILWNVLFMDETERQRRIRDSKKKTQLMSEEDLAQTGAIIDGFKLPRKAQGEQESDELFTLMLVSNAPETEELTPLGNELFTLMLVA
jgi:hypothetical protein